MKSYRVLSFIIIALSASLSAAPDIQFDTKNYDCGTIIEGKTEIVNAVFNVKNKGDAIVGTDLNTSIYPVWRCIFLIPCRDPLDCMSLGLFIISCHGE
jgi:hypothetical protein